MELTLSRKRLDSVFLLAFILFFLSILFFPSVKITFFAPALIITYYKKNLLHSLWYSFFSGFTLDLLSSYDRLGLHAIAYCLTSVFLYRQRRHFFADSLSTLPLMTFCFCFLSTLFLATLIQILENVAIFSSKWLFTDLLVMPLCDAFYAFTFFLLPALLFGKRLKKGKDYFLGKEARQNNIAVQTVPKPRG